MSSPQARVTRPGLTAGYIESLNMSNGGFLLLLILWVCLG